jgi:thioesterase domain-containing protein
VIPPTELLPAPRTPAAIARVEQAPVTVSNADGRLAPICFIRSWDGEAQLYANLVRHLPADQPVYTIAPPRGDDYRDYPRDVAAWAAWCREQLRAVPHDGPLALGGISFGGVIALDLAKLLVAEGRTITLVVMLDTRVPRGHPLDERPRPSLPHRVVHHANALFEVGSGRRLAYLKDKAGWQVHHLRTWLRSARERLAGTAPAETIRTPEDLPPLQRCIWRAYLKYRPDITTIPVAVYWTDESRGHTGDSTLGWGACQRGALEAHRIDGGHFEVLHEPNAAAVARRLVHSLERAREDPARRSSAGA